MGGESLSPDVGPLALQPWAADLYQALDSLRERLGRLERVSSQSAPPARDSGVTLADGDPQALGIVQEILSIPSSGLHPSELFTLAMDRASRLLAADRAMLFVAESGGARLVPRSAHGFRREDLESTSVRPGEGIVGRVFKERRVLAHTAGSDGEAPDAFIERFPVRDAIAVPVRAEDDVAGVLYVGRRRLGAPFSANDVLLLLVIADRVGGGLVHQGLLDRRTRHIARLAELAGAAGQLVATRPLTDVLGAACEIGRRLVDVGAAAVAVEVATGEVEVLAARGLPAAGAWRRVSIREGVTAELYARGEFLACRDVQSRPTRDRSFLGDAGFHGCLLLPLRLQGGRAGVFYLADTEVRDFSAEEIEAARVLAAMTASAVDSSRSGGERGEALAGAPSTHARAAQIEKARALGEMAGGLARELNDIFALILGKSRLLLARTHDESLREGLELLEEAAWRGADVVHRLIALAAPTSGEAAGPVNMTALVQDVIALTRPRWKDEAEGRGARIDLVTDLQDAPPVRGSETALREALVNLVLNAVDAMARGGRLSLATRSREGGVELALEDTGEGIAEGAQGRVFDPFFTTRSPKRMGLGLTVVQGVVLLHGGRIEISSAAGRGTRVMLWLPGVEALLAPPVPAGVPPSGTRVGPARRRETETDASADTGEPPETVAAPPAPLEEGEPRAMEEGRPRGGVSAPALRSGAASILVLEDEASVRSLLVEALTQAGHKVESATDGAAGLAKLDGGPFDVVLTDLALPQRSGLAIARSVKRRDPRTAVVLITGWGHLLDPERLREHGVDLMLVKPFRIERVLSVVGDALRLRGSS